MASDWNLLLERLLGAPLTANEYRLALAIARSTLGYRRRSERLGRRLLQEHSGITDARGFDRARRGLVEAGLLRYTPGRVGRGNRSTYELVLDPEKAALRRPKRRLRKGRVLTGRRPLQRGHG
jgi:Bacteriophage replication protein O